ncbi:unnamed protein product [Diatraea saccharalis]|uniref:Myb/SANT-like DNA-binding domain-containing protein n=1 Tax=Diatraea saccharalis TaxID=40085 RepID=A0A9N9QUI0_9NEOP|nr:unnamed protein product [Diatraea saccharalis]
MNENIDNNVSVLTMLDSQCSTSASVYKTNLNIAQYHDPNHDQNVNHTHSQEQVIVQQETDIPDTCKQSILWSKNSTATLLSLYEAKMSICDNLKKKSKMWTSIAEELKAMGIEVTSDQVRWKINALTKKYKDSIDSGQGAAGFKYFNEMHQILGQNHDTSSSYRLASGVQSQGTADKEQKKVHGMQKTPFRRLRAERRAKIELDKQWMDYIQKQDAQKHIRDERYERSLRLREEELQLKKKELEIKQSIALKKLQLKERKQEEILKIEREKCLLLHKLLENQ